LRAVSESWTRSSYSTSWIPLNLLSLSFASWMFSQRASSCLVKSRQEKGDALRDELLQLNNELAVLTRENVRKKRELEAALAQLKQTQAMLVHREKMASLGQMTAGVAHEINNPVSFVLSNHDTLQRDFEGLLSLITWWATRSMGLGEFHPCCESEFWKSRSDRPLVPC